MAQPIGEICRKSSSFEWKIADFSSLSEKNGDRNESPRFDCCEAVWRIELYANGIRESDIGYMAVLLRKLHSECSTHDIDFKISMKCGDELMENLEDSHIFSINSSWGWFQFIERDDVLEEMKNSSHKVLNISIDITLKSMNNAKSQSNNSLKNMSTCVPSSLAELLVDIKELYLNKSNCDVTIKVQEQEFSAHKAILGARSPVLAATFAHDMIENRSRILKIEDFEPDVVRDFLLYIYTADTEILIPQNVFGLYEIADKYGVRNLIKECRTFLEHNITAESVCNVLRLSEMHEEMQLMEFARTYITENADKVLSSDEWEEFRCENNKLAHDILKTIVLTKTSKRLN